MKDNRYNKAFSWMAAFLVISSLLLLPVELLPANICHEVDIGSPAALNCPADIVQSNDPGDCSAVVTYIIPTGAYRKSGPAPGATHQVGVVSTVQINLIDNSDSCTFTIEVVDDESPVFTFCPEDIVQSYDDGICQQVFFDQPEADDNCGVISLTQITGLSSGSVFPIGATLIEFEAADAAGNTAICSFTVQINGNHTTVLAGDGSSSELMAPQGAFRYQRAFYLITADEMAEADLETGMEVNTIGFTIGAQQSEATSGNFKVYLENTDDEISRMDTSWTVDTILTNSTTLAGIGQGEYEWQVISLCNGSEVYSAMTGFANDELDGCNQPYNLQEQDISSSTAKLVWESAGSLGFVEFVVEYNLLGSDTWVSATTTDSYLDISGLTNDTTYQWKVRTMCSTDSSAVSSRSFNTEKLDVCEEPTSLMVESTTDTSATVSWTEDTESARYNLAFRRTGTSSWINVFTFNDSYTFYGLAAGTTYEWKVRTMCDDGEGAFVDGFDFTTSGSLVCYAPEDLKTSGISESGATLSWTDFPGANKYVIRYRLKESISWNNAINGMMLVSDGDLKIPDKLGQYDINFISGDTFSYAGNGVYVAWEYSNPSGTVSTENKALCTVNGTAIKGVNGLDSLTYILSFNGRTDASDTLLPELLRSTNIRPETRLGSTSLKDSVEVASLYTLGHVSLNYGSPVPVSAMIKNFTTSEKTYSVNLKVIDRITGTIRLSINQDHTVPASCGEVIEFPDWIPKENGMDSLIVSIAAQAGENVVDNNLKYYLQNTNTHLHSYADELPVLNGAGFGNDEGLILSKYFMNGCGKVNGAEIYLHWSAASNPVYAVVLDENGAIVDKTTSITFDSTQTNKYQSFYFPNTPFFSNSEYYIGLAQAENLVKPYYPVGVQWDGKFIREGAFYRADMDGSNIVDHPHPGRLMIKAEIIPGVPVPFINGNDILCSGTTNTLQAASKTYNFADAVINVSSESSEFSYGAIQALGTPDVYPQYVPSPKAWISETPDGQREFIELHFPDTSRINYIDIYQTMNPGAIDTVYVFDSLGTMHMVYSDTAMMELEEASILEISFPLTPYRVSSVRIELSSDSIGGFHAIDAVSIGIIDSLAIFDSYNWSPGGETTSSIDINTAGNYMLTTTSNGSCSLSDSLEVITPAAIAAPTISLSGAADICLGDTVTLTSSEAEGNTWSTGETTQSIDVVESGTYSVTYNNGCETATSSDVIVTVNPLPVITFTGGAICPGGSATLNVVQGYNSYLWSTGETTQSIGVNTISLFQVIVTDNNGCVDSAFISTYYAPAPNARILGDPYYCSGDSTLLDAGANFSSYLWSNGETGRKTFVSTPGVVSVTVTNEHGCTDTDEVFCDEHLPPTPFISGSLSLCYGSATVLDAGEGYASYLWSTGEITNAIVTDTADTFTVEVTDAHGCKGMASATTNLDGAIPETPGPISGPAGGICMQSGLEYSIDPVLNSTHYVWKVPDEISIISGQGTNMIVVDAGVISSGVISVAASNTCGQSPTWNGRYLEVHGSPDTPGEITGQASGVCGLSGLTYSINDIYGSSSYTWTIPDGAVITSGAGTSEITVSFDAAFISGEICVSTVNACGESGQSCLQVNSKPAMPIDIFGPIEVCRKEKDVAYSVDPVFNADNYIWTVPLQASIKSGQGTPNVIVNFGNKAGFVSVQTENDCGLSSLQSLEVNVVPCDNGVAVIIEDPSSGGEITDDPVLNGSKHIFFPEVIASAGDFYLGKMTSMSWTLGESVIETVDDERTMLSQGFHQSSYDIITIGGSLDGSTFDVELYPVPTRDNLHIHISSESEPVNLVVEIYDLVGNVVYKENVRSKEFNHVINLYKYSANLFVMKVTDIDTKYEKNFKIIKVKL